MWKDNKKSPVTRHRNWRSAPCSPAPPTENKQPQRADSFHVVHKVPTGDSPYVKAKHVQLIDRDPNKAISLFWSAINSGDRVDSALKDMAVIMKQLNRTDEGIEAIKSFRNLCSQQAQESLDNVLIDLYKRGGRMDEHIELLQRKMKLVEDGVGFGGKRTKVARSQGKKFHISIEQEKSRLLGNLAWAYMQQNNYQAAEELYRKALSIEPDKNKQCNLAICLMNTGRIKEAKYLLRTVKPSSAELEIADPYIKSFDRAIDMLSELESQSVLSPNEMKERKMDVRKSFTSPMRLNSKSPFSSNNGYHQNQEYGFSSSRTWGLAYSNTEPILLEEFVIDAFEKQKEAYGENQFEYRVDAPLVVDRWNKGYVSQNRFHNGSDFLSLKNGSMCESGSNEGVSAGKSMITSANGEILASPISSGSSSVGIGKKGYLSQNTFERGSDFSGFKKRYLCESGSKNTVTDNGEILGSPVSPKLCDSQFSDSSSVDKWKKTHLSQNTSEKGHGFSGSKNGYLCESGSKNMVTCNGDISFSSLLSSKLDKDSASKKMNTADGEILFGSLVTSKLASTEPLSDSQFSINRCWSRLAGDNGDKKQQVMNGSMNLNSPYLSGRGQDGRSKTTVLGNQSETDKRKSTQEGLSETDCFAVNWKHVDLSNGHQDQGSKVTVISGSKNESDKRKIPQEEGIKETDSFAVNWKALDRSLFKSEKSWADMVEEEEEASSGFTDFSANKEDYPTQESSLSFQTPTKLGNRWRSGKAFHNENLSYPSQESSLSFPTPSKLVTTCKDGEAFHDENLNSNITHTHRQISNNQTENLQRKMEAVDVKGESECTRSTDSYLFGKSNARRSLYFDQKQKQEPADHYYNNNNTATTARGWKDLKPVRKGNRLQVFKEITLPDSPRV